MNKDDIQKFVLDNPKLASYRESTTKPGLFVLKYKKSVFFDNLWNDYLEYCRGTVVDKDFNIVSKPFKKIYNYGIEARAPVLDDRELVDAYRKVNGFMAALTWHDGDLLLSTTGSLDSDYIQYIRDHVSESITRVCEENPYLTFLFECVHEEDPHIIPEECGLHLIGFNNKLWEYDEVVDPTSLSYFAERMDCKTPSYVKTTVGMLKKLSKTATHEGFVAYTSSGEGFKIKTPYYLMKKLLARSKNLNRLASPAIKEIMPEEFYPLVDEIQKDVESFLSMNEQDRLVWIRNFLESING